MFVVTFNGKINVVSDDNFFINNTHLALFLLLLMFNMLFLWLMSLFLIMFGFNLDLNMAVTVTVANNNLFTRTGNNFVRYVKFTRIVEFSDFSNLQCLLLLTRFRFVQLLTR